MDSVTSGAAGPALPGVFLDSPSPPPPPASSQMNNLHISSRPQVIRSSTEPITEKPPSPQTLSLALRPARQRNRSPFSRSHLRSRSSANTLIPPAMARTQSMPLADIVGHPLVPSFTRPDSPLGSNARFKSPARSSFNELQPSAGRQEHINPYRFTPEFDSPRPSPSTYNSNALPFSPFPSGNTFPRRYRPSSPLRQLSQPVMLSGPRPITPTSSNSSPHISAAKFNEPYPVSYQYSTSFSSNSMPSTPTSARSRSPSISSLETIPDSPDAEEAALEADNIAKLKAAADAEDKNDISFQSSPDPRRGSSNTDTPGGVGGRISQGGSLVLGYNNRDKRKRWSVCGAERRGDLDLATIWED
ncbi:MAG: hypothetical protein M1829_005832 [Trizodia sp. TS-e1964]|nr:MAG: hypothetical protein M1829_005832 [Trizodia sp. TS-e1964]